MAIELRRDGDGRVPVRSSWLPAAVMVFLAALLPCGVGSCGEGDEPRGLTKQAIAVGDVPEALRKAAQKEFPGIKLDEARKNLDATGKLHSYEIRGRNVSDGKIREVCVATDGQILEKE